ncbi:MAG: alpha-N-acetylglucosaminidase TIM-barrel domain-containing protein [Verrucomicrobiae bacterium]|nr:alpha-N-acetylglucosaminidase TIM-barrel domain-containing protein [Verrucomicrobiae bacterium]
MKRKIKTAIPAMMMMMSASQTPINAMDSLSIVEKGQPVSAILLEQQATEVERHAASELARYIRLVSGAELPVKKTLAEAKSAGTTFFLVGRPKTNSVIARLVQKGLVHLSADDPGLDGFIIKSVSTPDGNFIALGGWEDRSALYAVYHFLEKQLGIGFFWEEDRIPKTDTIRCQAMDEVERPFFPERFYMQECIYAYTTRCWNIADWIKELDWAAKKKLNIVMLPKDAWNFFVTRDQLVAETKKRGMKPVLMGACERFDMVSPDFVAKNPGHAYVKMRWWSDPPYQVLHPKDPLFIERGRAMIRPFVEKYGDGNAYFLDPYSEQLVVDATPRQISDIRTSFADSTVKILGVESPHAVWIMWTWPFVSCGWSKEDVKNFLLHVPMKNSIVCDSHEPERPGGYHYKKFNYYEGRPWMLSFIHMYGGDDCLAGNLGRLIQDMEALIHDEKAKNCVGIYICPEMIYYNTIYFDLLARLSWNPKSVKLADFINDYAMRRYGKGSFPNMLKSTRSVVDAVYGAMPGMEAMYQHRMGPSGTLAIYLTKMAVQTYSHAPTQVRELEKTLRTALLEEKLKDNACYVKDVVDIFRQYLTTIFNLHLTELNRSGNAENFAEGKGQLMFLIECLEKVLSVYPPYQIRPMLERARGGARTAEIERTIKDGMLTFASKEWLLDYPSKDIYELVKQYYRPRLELYLEALGDSIKNKKPLDDKKLLAGYRKIEKRWLDEPLSNLSQNIYGMGNAVDRVKQVFDEMEKKKGLRREWQAIPSNELLAREEPRWKKICWEEPFANTSQWKITFFEGGKFKSNGQWATLTPGQGPVVFGRSVDVSLQEAPLLSFCFKVKETEPDGYTNFTVWAAWTDSTGRTWRNRVYQCEWTPFNEWVVATLNLRQVLGVFAEPARLKKIEIETSQVETEWKWMKAGAKL